VSVDLVGSTALVTGATAGIGRAVALGLAKLGAEVVVHGRDAGRGAETVRGIESEGGKARFVAADLSDAEQVRALASAAGEVDILVNNAGVYRFGLPPYPDRRTRPELRVRRSAGRGTRPGRSTDTSGSWPRASS
jgi:NAD(P)-dependent dehydrogenase (short-subunit alcohol dehydrogenase family)